MSVCYNRSPNIEARSIPKEQNKMNREIITRSTIVGYYCLFLHLLYTGITRSFKLKFLVT